jgi:hypothetical protein
MTAAWICIGAATKLQLATRSRSGGGSSVAARRATSAMGGATQCSSSWAVKSCGLNISSGSQFRGARERSCWVLGVLVLGVEWWVFGSRDQGAVCSSGTANSHHPEKNNTRPRGPHTHTCLGHVIHFIRLNQAASRKPLITVPMKPPMKPSQVFLGDSLIRGVRPKKKPLHYESVGVGERGLREMKKWSEVAGWGLSWGLDWLFVLFCHPH